MARFDLAVSIHDLRFTIYFLRWAIVIRPLRGLKCLLWAY